MADLERLLNPLLGDAGSPVRLAPTDISQFIRLGQCRRYLRLRLIEQNAGAQFMRALDVQPQAITPLLSRSGREFEQATEQTIAARERTISCSATARAERQVEDDFDVIRDAVTGLAPGETVAMFQPRLAVSLQGWSLRGDADLILFERNRDSTLGALIVDFKSSTQARTEHRLQVAFYVRMLQSALISIGAATRIEMGILYRGSALAAGEASLAGHRAAAQNRLGVAEGYLEVVEDVAPYLDAVDDLVLNQHALARKVARQPFEEIPFHLDYKCDGCLYNEFCMRWCAEHDDLSLVPLMTAGEKSALRKSNVATATALAGLKRRDDNGLLVAVPGHEPLVRELGGSWGLGPRLDELIVRAQAYRAHREARSLGGTFLPSGGHRSLPFTAPDHDPNLVKVYLDAQHDYLEDRVYLLGALVAGCEQGLESSDRRRSIVHLSPTPVISHEAEEALLTGWVREVIAAIAEVAAPDAAGEPKAPIHLVFYDRYDQTVLLQALGRHATTVFGATPMYDLMTQQAAFESPIISFLLEEIRTQRNYPFLCQSLQSVATYLKYPWDQPDSIRSVFRERLFDAASRFESDEIPQGEVSPWYTGRSRFNSQIPLEYAYAAWGSLAEPEPGKRDDYRPFRAATPDRLVELQRRRLGAMAHIAADLKPDEIAYKASFDLTTIEEFDAAAGTLAEALAEFVTIERHTELASWKGARLPAPERRVLAGETMLVRFEESDQSAEVVSWNRRNAEREAQRIALRPTWEELTAEQKKALRWTMENMVVRLRVDLSGVDCSRDHALGAWNPEAGDRFVLSSRWTFDSRLPLDQQHPFTPTPRQLLYGARCQLEAIERDGDETWVRVRMLGPSFAKQPGYLFNAFSVIFEDNERYTLDPDPSDIYGFWQKKVVDGLVQGSQNAFYTRISDRGAPPRAVSEAARAGQQRFMQGLIAAENEIAPPFEAGKTRFIGDLLDAPIVLVQGPPGTGKSFTTAFAIFARLQAAMAEDRPCRVIVSAKTHAAVDVLLQNLVETREQLLRLHRLDPKLARSFFDERLTDVTLFRLRPRGGVPDGVVPLGDVATGEAKALDRIATQSWCIVAGTAGGVYRLANEGNRLFGERVCDLLVIDEASQVNLPEAIMSALPLKDDGQVIVVGDHRQMPPIVKNDWANEAKRSFKRFRAYDSLFLTLREFVPEEHQVKFQESFRLHGEIAEFLRQEIYRHDGIDFFSRRDWQIETIPLQDPFLAAALSPGHPLVVIVHDEEASQQRNLFEQALVAPILEALADPTLFGLEPREGLGVVVPHRAQRTALREGIPALSIFDPATNLVTLSAVDTVERFQGGEREVIVVGATESDPLYLLGRSDFMLDPRRLNVAVSRAKKKLILVASRSVFDLFSADEEVFANAQLWKDLLRRTCIVPLWTGDRDGHLVQIWGNHPVTRPERH